jgi:hypothetical protein
MSQSETRRSNPLPASLGSWTSKLEGQDEMPILGEKVWMLFMVVMSGAAYGEHPADFGKYPANASWKS